MSSLLKFLAENLCKYVENNSIERLKTAPMSYDIPFAIQAATTCVSYINALLQRQLHLDCEHIDVSEPRVSLLPDGTSSYFYSHTFSQTVRPSNNSKYFQDLDMLGTHDCMHSYVDKYI